MMEYKRIKIAILFFLLIGVYMLFAKDNKKNCIGQYVTDKNGEIYIKNLFYR